VKHGDRRFGESGQIEELAPRMRPAGRLEDRARLAPWFVEPVFELGVAPSGRALLQSELRLTDIAGAAFR
jgi:hypothetical protein